MDLAVLEATGVLGWFSDEMGGYAGSSSSCFGSNHPSGNFGDPAVWSIGFGELGKSDHSGSFGARRSFGDFGSGNLGRFGGFGSFSGQRFW